MFIDNIVNRKLSRIEEVLNDLVRTKDSEIQKLIVSDLLSDPGKSVLDISEGEIVSDVQAKRRLQNIGITPYFFISITPKITRRNLLDVDGTDIQPLIQNPPNQRQSGWNMEGSYASIRRIGDGIVRTFSNHENLVLLQNGYMEYTTAINGHTFYWNQSAEENNKNPWLYPYPVIEYPVSFLALYKEIIDRTNYEGELIVSMRYLNINNHILKPYKPGTTIGIIQKMKNSLWLVVKVLFAFGR